MAFVEIDLPAFFGRANLGREQVRIIGEEPNGTCIIRYVVDLGFHCGFPNVCQRGTSSRRDKGSEVQNRFGRNFGIAFFEVAAGGHNHRMGTTISRRQGSGITFAVHFDNSDQVIGCNLLQQPVMSTAAAANIQEVPAGLIRLELSH